MSGKAALWNTLWGEWIIEELIRCGLKLSVFPLVHVRRLLLSLLQGIQRQIQILYMMKELQHTMRSGILADQELPGF